MNKATRKEVENITLHNSSSLCKLAEMLGYGGPSYGQLQCPNGAFVSSLLDFIDDNPGVMEKIHEFVMENIESYDLDGEDDDEDETE